MDLDRVDTVYSRQERRLTPLKVPEVRACHFFQEEIQLSARHSLDDEALVRAEEEKAARGTTCLSSLEDVCLIAFGFQRREKYLSGDAVTRT